VSVLQTWLSGLIALGALYLVGTQGKGLESFFSGAETFVSGTEEAAIGQK
jgi:hypothetical protein